MFEPLPSLIRLRRTQFGLTLDRLAKLAGVSRRQLHQLEDGKNVSLLFLTKVAKVLEITDLQIGDLRLRASQPELPSIVRSAQVLEQLKQDLPMWEEAAGRIREASTTLNSMVEQALTSAGSTAEISSAADRLANLPPEERQVAGEILRSLADAEPAARVERPDVKLGVPARRRNRA